MTCSKKTGIRNMLTALRLSYLIPLWTLYYVCSLCLSVPGFIVVPFAIWFGVRRPSIITGREIFTAPKWLHVYGNEQEGFDPQWAIESKYKGWPVFWRRYSWAAWRNKTSNLRFIKTLHPPPDPARIWVIEGGRWYLCGQGILAMFHYTKKSGAIFKIGWQYKPEDRDGITQPLWRVFGCGFTFRTHAT